MGKQWQTLFFGAPESLQMVIAAMKLKDAYSLEGNYDQPRKHIKKQRLLCQQSPSVKAMVFPAVLWELDCQESWVLKNWCFWAVVFEKILESPLDCKEIHPVHPKGNQSWIVIGRTDAKAETPVLWTLMRRTDSFERPWCWERLKVGREGDNRG